MGHSLEPTFILPEHYHAFGRIVQAFVQVEDFYTGMIENITGVPNGTAFFLLSITGYDGVKNILKTIISDLAVPEDQRKKGLDLMDKVNDKSLLRNNAAHNCWTPGKRPKSIKPVVIKAKGRLITMGIEDNEKDWIAEELEAEADSILVRAAAVGNFLISIGAFVAK